MKVSLSSSRILEFAGEITAIGPIAPAYDGLRVLQHPARAFHALTGTSDLITPVTIDVWPALTCNARCPLCPYRLSGARDEVDRTGSIEIMPLDLAQSLFAGAKSIGIQSVILTGGGDPLINPSLLNIVRTIRECKLQWGLFTNGILLQASMAKSLLKESPEFLRISLDAGNVDLHDRTYGVSGDFDRIVANAVAAARIASEMRSDAFGLSFTLLPDVSDTELAEIRELILRISTLSNGGLGMVAFRPRLVHYLRRQPLIPQPHVGSYRQLAERIQEQILCSFPSGKVKAPKCDLKQGLFTLADSTVAPTRCLSSGWMTTITQDGTGYISAELAGDTRSNHQWGTIKGTSDFQVYWNGTARKQLHAQLESGQINVPVVHRTSPVDEFLKGIQDIAKGPMDQQEARILLAELHQSRWYRSSRGHFV